MSKTKKCIRCGGVITQKASESVRYFETKKYCSNSCHNDARRGIHVKPPRECVRCGKHIYGAHNHLNKKYCSHACYVENLRDGIGIKKPYRQYDAVCEECGCVFQTIPSLVGKYCSRDCSLKNTTIKLQDTDYTRPINKVDRKCKICGEMFKVWPYELKRRPCNYCSNRCQIIAIRTLEETSIERKIREELEKRNIPFVAQAQVGNFFADFKVGNIIIECDGIYWHSLKENSERDKRKNKLYKKHGYTVFRFTDKQINTDIESCMKLIEDVLTKGVQLSMV